MNKHTSLAVTDESKKELAGWIKSKKTQRRYYERAKIIMALHEGKSNKQVAEEMKTRQATISKWRKRFVATGISGLYDAPRSGKPAQYNQAHEQRILKTLDKEPPKGYSKWNGKLLADHLKDVHKGHVWRVLRKHKVHLQRNRSWCISTDPEFSAKAADIIGLYLQPQENAVVLCIDEKPSIQALERSQGWLKLPDGRAITGYSHEYKRNGTITLFAALDIATGQVKGKLYKRKRRIEFLDFMNEIVQQHGNDRPIHVIVDNFRTHKPKHDKWQLRHKNVHFHYTPTHASWLNMVEIWFSILSRHALKNKSFSHVKELIQAINDYVQVYNQTARPFQWTKATVHPKTPTINFADL
ncbi:MAG: IS630 family transposase [Chitinophagales bacterium]